MVSKGEVIEPSIQRCSGCGAWVWRPDVYGCQTCRIRAAEQGDGEQ